MRTWNLEVLSVFDETAEKELESFLRDIDNDAYVQAAELILDAQAKGNRVHITGIGKPGHVSAYGASLLSSTGTPTYFLHGTEAVHGSCGQLVPGDVVIAISNSGETAELKATVTAIKNNGCSVIGVTGNPDSWLAKQSEVHLFAGVPAEGDPLNRAPRASILVENLVIQRLSLLLQAYRNLDAKQYVKWHPGGTLGNLRENEK
jgi:D-arabinose 5-phosphate isomerase GutQ